MMRRILRAWRAATYAHRLSRAESEFTRAVRRLKRSVRELDQADAKIHAIEEEQWRNSTPPG